MGGDGGVIASNRRYLRGAGTADKMGDRTKGTAGVESEELECLEKMQNCALTGHAFDYKNDLIVTCAFGNLYRREAAIEALLSMLSRKSSSSSSTTSSESPSGLGKHIRKLKDLVPVYFNLVKDSNGKYVPTCPITNVEFNGKQPAFVIVKKQKKKEEENDKAVVEASASSDEENKVNVLSERAMKEIGMESLQLEYGPFEKDDIIRLAPSSRDLIQIKQEYERRSENNKNNKKGKKKKNRSRDPSKKKKRKDTTEEDEEENTVAGVSNNNSIRKKKKKNSSLSSGGNAASQARSNVISSISSNSVFSSIFKSSAEVSEKEKKDNLFAR